MDSKEDHHAQKPTGHWRHAAAGKEQELVVAEYPQRPWEPDCSYYLKFGRCGHGMKCMFNHPPKPSGGQWQRHTIAGDGEKQGQETEYPQRPEEPDCSYYLKFGRCGHGMKCMFNHPPKPSGGQWRRHTIAGDGEQQRQETEYPQRPEEPDCSYYLNFGRCGLGMKCMFNHPPKPSGGQWWRHTIASHGEQQGQETEYPQRPEEPDCSYYLKFGRCGIGMKCMFNHPPRKLVCIPAGVCKCNHHQVEEVKLNSLGLPLRPAAGLCSYYMQKGICKFGTNCKFHHPDRSESEQAMSSRQNFFSRLGDIIVTPEPDLPSPLGPPPLELPTPSLLGHSSKEPVQVYSCSEQSGRYQQQHGDSHSEPDAKPARYRYTRDQLLQLREDMEKGKKSDSGRGYISWNDEMDKALLDTLVEYYNKGDRCQNGWKSHVYTAAIKNIREKCKVEITKDNIISRNRTFDKHFTIINGMLETSGFGWDWNKNKISVDSDSVWETYVVKNKEAAEYRHKTVLYWDSISLVFGKYHATGEAAKSAADSSEDMSKEDHSNKEYTSSTTSGSLQQSGDSSTSIMAEKLDKFTEALKEDTPKGPTSKEILNTLNEVEGLDEDTLLDLFDILTGDARKYESLLALPVEMRKRWLLKQLRK